MVPSLALMAFYLFSFKPLRGILGSLRGGKGHRHKGWRTHMCRCPIPARATGLILLLRATATSYGSVIARPISVVIKGGVCRIWGRSGLLCRCACTTHSIWIFLEIPGIAYHLSRFRRGTLSRTSRSLRSKIGGGALKAPVYRKISRIFITRGCT